MSEVFTPKELAERWKVSATKVRGWCASGRLYAADLSDGGGRATWRIREEDATEFWNSLQVKTKKKRGYASKVRVFSGGSFDDI